MVTHHSAGLSAGASRTTRSRLDQGTVFHLLLTNLHKRGDYADSNLGRRCHMLYLLSPDLRTQHVFCHTSFRRDLQHTLSKSRQQLRSTACSMNAIGLILTLYIIMFRVYEV